MLTYLDLLVIVSMVLAAASLLALCLMFLVRSPRIKKACLYIVAALGVYAASIGIRIGMPLFPVQAGIGMLVAGVSVASVVLSILAKGSEKKCKIAQLMAAGSLIVGIINAIL